MIMKNSTKKIPEVYVHVHSSHATFATIPDNVTDQPALSWRAKGILAYILGQTIGREMTLRSLVIHSTDGTRAVKSALQELRDARYMGVAKRHAANNEVNQIRYLVVDRPAYEKSVHCIGGYAESGTHVHKHLPSVCLLADDDDAEESSKRLTPRSTSDPLPEVYKAEEAFKKAQQAN